MNLPEYIQHVRRFDSDYKALDEFAGLDGYWRNGSVFTRRFRLQHASEGLATELFELIAGDGDVNTMEEIGDVVWYAALGLDACGFEDDAGALNAVCVSHAGANPLKELITVIGVGQSKQNRSICDRMKRWKFYKLEMPEEDMVRELGALFYTVLIHVAELAAQKGWTIGQVFDANIRKLTARHGQSFNAERAINRDTANEMEQMISQPQTQNQDTQ